MLDLILEFRQERKNFKTSQSFLLSDFCRQLEKSRLSSVFLKLFIFQDWFYVTVSLFVPEKHFFLHFPIQRFFSSFTVLTLLKFLYSPCNLAFHHNLKTSQTSNSHSAFNPLLSIVGKQSKADIPNSYVILRFCIKRKKGKTILISF